MKSRAEINTYQREWRAANKDKVAATLAKPDVRAKRRKYWTDRYARLGDQIRAERKGYSAKYRAKKPWKTLLHAAQRRSVKSGLPFNLTDEWAEQRYTGFCELTGIAFDLGGGKKPGPKPLSPSIDRIDHVIGYKVDNCRFVLACVNTFRGQMSDRQMMGIAEALIKSDRGAVHDRDVNAAINIARIGLDALVEGAAA